jgi:hypothetical protein
MVLDNFIIREENDLDLTVVNVFGFCILLIIHAKLFLDLLSFPTHSIKHSQEMCVYSIRVYVGTNYSSVWLIIAFAIIMYN